MQDQKPAKDKNDPPAKSLLRPAILNLPPAPPYVLDPQQETAAEINVFLRRSISPLSRPREAPARCTNDFDSSTGVLSYGPFCLAKHQVGRFTFRAAVQPGLLPGGLAVRSPEYANISASVGSTFSFGVKTDFGDPLGTPTVYGRASSVFRLPSILGRTFTAGGLTFGAGDGVYAMAQGATKGNSYVAAVLPVIVSPLGSIDFAARCRYGTCGVGFELSPSFDWLREKIGGRFTDWWKNLFKTK